jgi:hypothetical protein
MEPKECSETSAFNIQTPGKYPEENLPCFHIVDYVGMWPHFSNPKLISEYFAMEK